MYKVPSGPAPANESLQRFMLKVWRKLSSLNSHVFPPSRVMATSVREPSGVESSLTRSNVAAGVPLGMMGVSPVGSRLSVAIAATMMLFASLGLTKMIGSPAPRFGLPSNRYSSDFGGSCAVGCESSTAPDNRRQPTPAPSEHRFHPFINRSLPRPILGLFIETLPRQA